MKLLRSATMDWLIRFAEAAGHLWRLVPAQARAAGGLRSWGHRAEWGRTVRPSPIRRQRTRFGELHNRLVDWQEVTRLCNLSYLLEKLISRKLRNSCKSLLREFLAPKNQTAGGRCSTAVTPFDWMMLARPSQQPTGPADLWPLSRAAACAAKMSGATPTRHSP